ncbi:DUF86 domain-containing protein [Lederbergia lenta]|uniref:YutE n=1 Tax=Lederbergia lenta TaxID=1467 RepID=A0A2X4WPI0_LEDLE|nr:DUF86 domain-containing protein [Lederbergia lenta]MCM3112950.1 DUF86 domain-containing protein [Lederbergia lenta]MEC2326661.1 DUF86 domain-containing protein [Lederbergia lenta]SQI61608.1 YutE [Lederbergia lenta]
MYFIDRDKMEETLIFMEKQMKLINNNKTWDSELEKSALERLATTVIEAILDTGNAMIDGFIMRDPGSYEDIVDILMDEKVINAEMEAALKSIISFRKMLVQQYTNIEHEALLHLLQDKMNVLEQFPTFIRKYLATELGPVSAFKN